MRYDLIIRGGEIYDGTGRPPWRGDIGLRDGRIQAMEPQLDAGAEEEVNATGLWVTPGFVDIHTHYDIEMELRPGLDESVRHGVSTVVMGNCSLSTTFGEPRTIAEMFARVETLPVSLLNNWLSRAESFDAPEAYMEHVDGLSLGPNVAPMLGHSTLRAKVMGLERSLKDQPSDAELDEMCALAERALQAGCIGISADMVPWHMMSGEFRGRTIPSQHARYREYKALAEVCRSQDKVFQVTPNPQRPLSFFQILSLGTGISRQPLRLTVLSAIDSVCARQLWRLFPLTARIFNRWFGGNLRFQTLTEPFSVYSFGPVTPYFEEFPAGVRLNDAADHQERLKLWRDPAFVKQFKREWNRQRGATFHRDFARMTINSAPEKKWHDRTVAQIAASENLAPIDWFINALRLYDRDLVWESTGANDRPAIRHKLLRDPDILPGFTDAGAHLENLGYYDGAISLLRQAVADGAMSVERAVQRVTSEPADWFRLPAGRLAVGAQADLNLLDPRDLTEPRSLQEFVTDELLGGGPRVVRRGSATIVRATFIKGTKVVADGEPLAALGKIKTGRRLVQPDNLRAVADDPRMVIDRTVPSHPFRDYWDVFVLKHTHPGNIAAHAVGMALPFVVVPLALALQNYWWLLLLPMCQGTGLLGHLVFERNHIDRRDAVYTWRAVACLWKMFFLVGMGRYRQEVERVQSRLAEYQSLRRESPHEFRQAHV